MPTGRLPDFLVIGAMKAGSTSLHMWLAEQPEIWGLPRKEPHFFSQDWVWSRGLDWYQSLFDAAPRDSLAFESSTSYTDPDYENAAARILEAAPDARLIYVVRHPIDRLRSDYRHTVNEARQMQPLTEAIADPQCGHVLRSLYHHCLTPYRTRFDRRQLLVITFEGLVRPPHTEWERVLDHLELSARPAPGGRHNATDERTSAPALKRFLRRTGLLRAARHIPQPARRLATQAMSTDRRTKALLASADAQLPASVTDRIWTDVSALENWLELDHPLWTRGSPTASRVDASAPP